MSEEIENLSHKERIANALIAIAKDVSANDRKEAITDLITTSSTISRYLNGLVLDTDTGIKFLEYFREKIKCREAKLSAA